MAGRPRRFLVREGLWVRLIGVAAALSARGYATDNTVVIDVTDEFVPGMPGAGASGGAGSRKPPQAEPDLACDIGSLGCVYLGGFTFAQLARSLRVTELRAGAITRADAMFIPIVRPGARSCSETSMTDTPPDRLSTDPNSPYYDAALLERGVGVNFDGKEKTNVEE